MRSRRRRQFRRKLTRVLLFFFTATGLFYFCLALLFVQENEAQANITSPLPRQLSSFFPTQTQNTPTNSEAIKKIVDTALAGGKGTYGIVIRNLRTGESFFLNEHRPYETASLYKLWVMATAYEQIKAGTLKETDVLSQDADELNRKFSIASEAAELHEGKITYTIDAGLNKMITISDNYAALLLTERVRLSAMAKFLQENGFTASKVGTPQSGPISTPSDIALFLEKMYKAQLVDEAASAKMTDLLKKQRLKKKLPKYLPKDTPIAHKTGELGAYSHDAGIVYTEDGDYLIVIMSESNSQTGANERIATISKNVYEYFTEK